MTPLLLVGDEELLPSAIGSFGHPPRLGPWSLRSEDVSLSVFGIPKEVGILENDVDEGVKGEGRCVAPSYVFEEIIAGDP